MLDILIKELALGMAPKPIDELMNFHESLCLLSHHGPSTSALMHTAEPISFFDSVQSLHLTCSISRDCLYFLILDAEASGSHL